MTALAVGDTLTFSVGDFTGGGGWALTAMRWANAGGLITGTTVTTPDPGGDASCAQGAAILRRFGEKAAK